MIHGRMKIALSIIIFVLVMGLGLILSRGSIPNQEGYFELSWKINHLDFNGIFKPEVTPIIFLVAYLIEKTFPISLASSWKIMDLVFLGFISVFFANIFWIYQKPKKFIYKITPIIIICSLLNYIYSFTSMTGEGIPILFALLGLYLWNKRRFIPGMLLLVISYLSKYTLYLVAPGILIWTLINIRKFTRQEIQNLFISFVLFISVFLIYNSIKNWNDFSLQVPSLSLGSTSVTTYFHILNMYLIAIIISAPIIVLFSFLYPSYTNLFWLCGISAFLILSKRHFYWNHPQQIISMFMLYFFSSIKANKLIKYKYLILQSIFCVGFFILVPVNSGLTQFFYKHMTINDSKLIDEEIKKDYHGGKIGYYLNRRFDEPFPNYEISYMDPAWDFIIEDTEYVVVPTGGLPQQLVNFTQCQYTFYHQVERNSIFKVTCPKKSSGQGTNLH